MTIYTQGLTGMGELLKNRRVAFRELQKTYRQQMFDKFHRRLNIDRAGTTYKPLPFIAVKMKLNVYTDDELTYLYKQCLEARNFSSLFYWATNPKNVNEAISRTC